MLDQLDHLVCLCRDLADAKNELEALFGADAPGHTSGPDWASVDKDGVWTAEYRLHGGAIEFIAPSHRAADPARTCPGLREKVEATGTGFKSLVLGTDDLEGAHSRLAAAGLEPDEITAAAAEHLESGERRTWRRFRCPDRHLFGPKVFVIERAAAPVVNAAAPALESVEIETHDLQRARRLWGSLLGQEEAAAEGEDTLTFSLQHASLVIRRLPRPLDGTLAPDRFGRVRIRSTR